MGLVHTPQNAIKRTALLPGSLQNITLLVRVNPDNKFKWPKIDAIRKWARSASSRPKWNEGCGHKVNGGVLYQTKWQILPNDISKSNQNADLWGVSNQKEPWQACKRLPGIRITFVQTCSGMGQQSVSSLSPIEPHHFLGMLPKSGWEINFLPKQPILVKCT